jgi:hypothetical protein
VADDRGIEEEQMNETEKALENAGRGTNRNANDDGKRDGRDAAVADALSQGPQQCDLDPSQNPGLERLR